MNLETFQLLNSNLGKTALSIASGMQLENHSRLIEIETLRKRFSPELAMAAWELTYLRKKAKAKFSHADQLFFTSEALEQSTSETLARYRASRFQGYRRILDIGCGIGGDLLAFAEAGHEVIGIESDPLRAAMAKANLKARNLKGEILNCDALNSDWPEYDAIFCDPARRPNGRRVISPGDSLPSPSSILAKADTSKPIAFKLAPGVSPDEAHELGGEVEFISLDGELKECVVWLGVLRKTTWCATVLRSEPDNIDSLFQISAEKKPDWPEVSDLGEYIYDPAAAVVRAGLIGLLAEQCQLIAMDYRVATLTGQLIDTPFATRFQVVDNLPIDVKKVSKRLRELEVGRVTIIKRGVEVDADELNRKWKGSGTNHKTIFLTPISGKPRAIICDKDA